MPAEIIFRILFRLLRNQSEDNNAMNAAGLIVGRFNAKLVIGFACKDKGKRVPHPDDRQSRIGSLRVYDFDAAAK